MRSFNRAGRIKPENDSFNTGERIPPVPKTFYRWAVAAALLLLVMVGVMGWCASHLVKL